MLNRKSHAFILRVSGAVEYIFDGKVFAVNSGEMFFLPAGSNYEMRTTSYEDSEFVSISFAADIPSTSPALYSLENFSDAGYICSHFADMWNLGSQSDKFKCFSLFYDILAYISNIEHTEYSMKRRFEMIEPGVTYLKSHIFDPSLKVDMLHNMCGISGTYFRRIFISQFGTTPQNYITNKRIAYAESIISGGNFDTVSEVANAVGYTDPLYFSRAFKKKYGISPSNMNKDLI